MALVRKPDDQVPLGASGLQVAPLGWGMWRFAGASVADARARIDAALEIGVTLFDTADIYGFSPDAPQHFGEAERLLGRVLAESPALRERMVLASKGGITPPTPYNSSARYLIEACEASLSRMGVDCIDLYQIHRPDLLAHPAEIAEAFDRLRQGGKIRAAGVSNYTAAQTSALMTHMKFPLASTQPELSPLAIEPLQDGVLDLALQHRLAVLAWSPLAQGRLAADGGERRAAAVIGELDRIAARDGVSRSAVAYAWVMAHPSGAIPLIGTQSPGRIREAAQAYAVRLTRADWYAILVAARGAPMP
jgi:predicted oxidoreductase